MDKIVQKQTVETAEYPHKELTRKVIGVAMEVHRNLGSGFLESVYEAALAVEFRNQKILFEQQKPIDVYYKDSVVKQFFCDFLVDEILIVELKAIKHLTDVEMGQLLNFGAGSLQYKRVIS